MDVLFKRQRGWFERVVALSLATLATVTYGGCGSSEQNIQSGVPGISKVIDREKDYYRYEGEGKDKKKVALSLRERRKVQHEAKAKLEGQ